MFSVERVELQSGELSIELIELDADTAARHLLEERSKFNDSLCMWSAVLELDFS